MNELTLELTEVSPQVFCGEDESNIKYIKTLFPKLKIVARGSKLIVFGEEHLLKDFQEQMEKLISYTSKYNRLDERSIDSILSASNPETTEKVREEDVIVHGVNGKVIRPQTKNQVKLVEMMRNNDMVFAVGPAGTGKTYVGVALAVKALKEKQVRRIILTRPAVEAGENLGFLPGDLKEKLGLTYIFITHDLTSITYFCSRVIFLKDGSVVADSPVSELSKLDVPYAKELLGAVLDFNAESA